MWSFPPVPLALASSSPAELIHNFIHWFAFPLNHTGSATLPSLCQTSHFMSRLKCMHRWKKLPPYGLGTHSWSSPPCVLSKGRVIHICEHGTLSPLLSNPLSLRGAPYFFTPLLTDDFVFDSQWQISAVKIDCLLQYGPLSLPLHIPVCPTGGWPPSHTLGILSNVSSELAGRRWASRLHGPPHSQ